MKVTVYAPGITVEVFDRPPSGASVEGTTIPAAASITDAGAVVWTLGVVYPTDPPNRDVLRNGVAVDRGVLLEWKRGIVWNQYSNHGALEWWKELPTGSVQALPGETPDHDAPYTPPVESYPPTLAAVVGVPVSLAPFVTSALPITWTPLDTAEVSLTADGWFTVKVPGPGSVVVTPDDGHA